MSLVIAGWVASALVFVTFFMKTMIPLRIVGMCANVCMIVYTAIAGVYPVTQGFKSPRKEGMYTTLLMSTGLTFGTISALFGLSHDVVDQAQYSALVAAVIAGLLLLEPARLSQAIAQVPALQDERFAGLQWTFVRVRYSALTVDNRYRLDYWGEPWAIDAPAAEQNLSRRLRTATAIQVNDPVVLTRIAREELREKFLQADLGITGANFAVAETGTIVLVTNEGNGRMATSLPRVHVAVMGVEKVIPSMSDLVVFLAILARSATGQRLSVYTSLVQGPRRPGEVDGPEEFHLVLLDNGRIDQLAGPLREALNCLRCGACLNVCPVYREIGGHAYGYTYPGPIGILLTSMLNGPGSVRDLAHAASLCGAGADGCPVRIDIPRMLVDLRREVDEQKIAPRSERLLFRLFARIVASPALYGVAARVGRALQRPFVRDGRLRRGPFVLAAGTYTPSKPGADPAAWTFMLKGHVALEGGYPPGGGPRHPRLNETVLSGNVGVTNVFNVVTSPGLGGITTPARLDGFVIRDGHIWLGDAPGWGADIDERVLRDDLASPQLNPKFDVAGTRRFLERGIHLPESRREQDRHDRNCRGG